MSVWSRYEHSLLDLCGQIHGAYTGSGDGICSDEAQTVREWLGWRLNEGWEDFSAYPWYRSARFDNAVRELCSAALAELEAHLAARSAWRFPEDSGLPRPNQ